MGNVEERSIGDKIYSGLERIVQVMEITFSIVFITAIAIAPIVVGIMIIKDFSEIEYLIMAILLITLGIYCTLKIIVEIFEWVG